MAELSRNDKKSAPELGIPTGLNRIKTRRGVIKDRPGRSLAEEDSEKLNESPKVAALKEKHKHRAFVKGRVKFHSPKQGFQKARKIGRWITSNLSKHHDQRVDKFPHETQYDGLYAEDFINQDANKVPNQSLPDDLYTNQLHKSLKSFSHELGPKGGVKPLYPRAHSLDDLKVLLESFSSRFDAAKETVNVELDFFSRDLMEVLEKDSLPLDGKKTLQELLVLARKCVSMASFEFRTTCESLVQELSEKRQKCQTGLVKWQLTRMLYILTRCTRLLNLEKDIDPGNEKSSLHKVQEYLEKLPFVETDWVVRKDSKLTKNNPPSPSPSRITYRHLDSHIKTPNKTETETNLLQEQEQEQEINSDDTYLEMCRICEERVLAKHLEPHSYICAYADKCNLQTLDVNERLWKLTELLEHILESRNLRNETSDNSKVNLISSAIPSETCSPRISKGFEGMFEDLHEMDTACIEDSQMANLVNFKAHLGAKFPPSSTGSITSTSSTNTPRAGNFDFSWLEGENPFELEDVQQIVSLAEITRCAAETDISEEGSHKVLLTCIQDLKNVLLKSKFKALVVDTFGSRIENLLREKYMIVCELVDTTSDSVIPERPRLRVNNESRGSKIPIPLPLSNKERTSIEDFEIIKPINRGAFGKVFLARKRATGDLFAIKVLKKMDLIRKNDIERILAERNILITVRNHFVVRFFYSFTSKENLYLVMEYLNGGDLYSLLRKVGCLDEDVVRVYVAELVLALEYLHGQGIVHRDLKPDNILIAQDGHIKLTDFGLSKIGLMNSTGDLTEHETNEAIKLDESKDTVEKGEQSAVGTPDYLAPEILLGTQHGHAADWWSAGVVLFELITGVPPFNAKHPEEVFDNILNRKIPWPENPSAMSDEAQDLIERLLDLDPNKRLGFGGSSEVKAHPFFWGIDWDNLALQKAAFVPEPENIDDTSYFVSRYASNRIPDDEDCSSASEDSELFSDSGLEKMDECSDLAGFDSSPLDLSLINFSFKNLSQLASINHDVLLQGGKSASKSSSPINFLN